MINPHYRHVITELNALPLLEKISTYSPDVAEESKFKTAELSSDLIDFIITKSAHFKSPDDLNSNETIAFKTANFLLTLLDTHVKLASVQPIEISTKVTGILKFASTMYLDSILATSLRSKNATECRMLGREYAVELLRGLLA